MRYFRVLSPIFVLLSFGAVPPLRPEHPLPGPHFLHCEKAGEAVQLTWDDLGVGDGSLHAVYLYRDRDLLVELTPDATSFNDPMPAPGRHTYQLQIVVRKTEQLIATRECEIETPGSVAVRCAVFGGIATPPQVLITWEVLPAEIKASSIQVLRDGEVVAELPPDALEHSEEPSAGKHTYTVKAILAAAPGDYLVGSCVATYEPPVIGGLVRGDTNTDGEHDLSDGILILLYLFLGEREPPCLAAADADDSGVVELTDAVYYLSFLFLGGAAPPAPFPECGHDGTSDELSCNEFGRCFNPPPP